MHYIGYNAAFDRWVPFEDTREYELVIVFTYIKFHCISCEITERKKMYFNFINVWPLVFSVIAL